ncbi:MAG: hypothetical protein R3310_00265 [Candidatus Competibacteraceae bacterium]|nr:hypothetical protein [Candidatus Competibacteraceae bacterium]
MDTPESNHSSTRRRPPLPLRLFLASPGDVAEERRRALEALERLPGKAFLTERVSLRVVAWDKPGAGTPLLATLPPQEAIARGLPRPSDCDIVVVILWSRLGTPLPEDFATKPDGSAYLSGTEWEFWDAVRAPVESRPQVLLYRRTETPNIPLDDPDYEDKGRQWRDGFNPDQPVNLQQNPTDCPRPAVRPLVRRSVRQRWTVPRPGSRNETEGIVLCQVLDTAARQSLH